MRKTQLRLSAGLIACGAAMLALPATGVAQAEAAGFTYQTPTANCTYVMAGLYRPGNVQSGGQTWSQYYGTSACNRYWGRPAGYISARVALLGWDAIAGQWIQCVTTGTYYNTATDTTKGILVNWSTGQLCGAIYPGYRTRATGLVRDTNNNWRGGDILTAPG